MAMFCHRRMGRILDFIISLSSTIYLLRIPVSWYFLLFCINLYIFLLKMFEWNKNNRYICICNINQLTQTIYQL